MTTARNYPVQTNRIGKTAITFFVKKEAKCAISAALADGGYGITFQEGMVNLLNEFLQRNNRPPCC